LNYKHTHREARVKKETKETKETKKEKKEKKQMKHMKYKNYKKPVSPLPFQILCEESRTYNSCASHQSWQLGIFPHLMCMLQWVLPYGRTGLPRCRPGLPVWAATDPSKSLNKQTPKMDR